MLTLDYAVSECVQEGIYSTLPLMDNSPSSKAGLYHARVYQSVDGAYCKVGEMSLLQLLSNFA